MSKAVENFNFNHHIITEYFISLIEFNDTQKIFNKSIKAWEDLTVLLIEALKLHSNKEIKFDFYLMFKDLSGKIPYKDNVKKIDKTSATIIFNAFHDALVDSLYNIKIDKNRRNIIIAASDDFKKNVIKSFNREKK